MDRLIVVISSKRRCLRCTSCCWLAIPYAWNLTQHSQQGRIQAKARAENEEKIADGHPRFLAVCRSSLYELDNSVEKIAVLLR